MTSSPPRTGSGASPSSSLWGRSKKAVGKNFTFLQHVPKQSQTFLAHPGVMPDSSPSSKHITTPPTSDKSEAEAAKAAHARRRDQVRRAQRNHRERKENYIRSLEREVLRLRDEEAAVSQVSKSVQEENAMLKTILRRHGISVPDRSTNLNSIATVSVRDQGDGGQSLHVAMPDITSDLSSEFGMLNTTPPSFVQPLSMSSPESNLFLDSRKSLSPHNPLDSAFSPDSSQTGYQSAPTNIYNAVPKSPPGPHPAGLDSSQIGIDFVLSLEQPCMGHTRANPTNDEPSGHSLTAHAPLLTSGPAALSSGLTWQVPAIEIERLLDLSSTLNLEGELTPVQAWARLRATPGFETLDADTLETLKYSMMQEVQCYGFGAVIDESTFNFLVQKCLAGRRT